MTPPDKLRLFQKYADPDLLIRLMYEGVPALQAHIMKLIDETSDRYPTPEHQERLDANGYC